MFCWNCGKEIENCARFCKYCGSSIEPEKQLSNDEKEEIIESQNNSKENKKPSNGIDKNKIVGIIKALSLCIVAVCIITIVIIVLDFAETKRTPIAYVDGESDSCERTLYLQKGKGGDVIEIASFNAPTRSTGCNVWFSDNGKYMVYGIARCNYNNSEVVGVDIYYLDISSFPRTGDAILVDQINSTGFTFDVKVFSNGLVLLFENDYDDNALSVKSFNGDVTEKLFSAPSVDYLYALNDDETSGLIYVYDEENRYHWKYYSLQIDDCIDMKYVCTTYDSEISYLDLKSMANNNTIVSLTNDTYGGYGDVELYIDGVYEKTLLRDIPYGCSGPYGFTVESGNPCFYLICQIDGIPVGSGAYNSEQQWNFFYFDGYSLNETNVELRNSGSSIASNLYDPVCSLNNGLFVFKRSTYDGSVSEQVYLKRTNNAFSVYKIGEVISSGHFIFENKDGKKMLLFATSDDKKFNIFCDGSVKCLLDNQDYTTYSNFSSGNERISIFYTKYDSDSIYWMSSNDFYYSTSERNIRYCEVSNANNDDYIEQVVPYSADEILYIGSKYNYYSDGCHNSLYIADKRGDRLLINNKSRNILGVWTKYQFQRY